MKSMLIREMDGFAWLFLGIYLVVMLGVSVLGAFIAWKVTGKQKPTELTYLTILAFLFIVETVRLYQDGFAAVEE